MDTLTKSPHDLTPRIRAIFESAFTFIEEDPRRSRLLAELQTAEALASRRHEVIDTLTDIMVGQVRDLLGAGAGADDTIKLTALTVTSGLLELAVQWYRNQIEVDRSQLIDFATALVVTTTDITGALERQLSQAGTDHTDE